jgi:hypothetical protein
MTIAAAFGGASLLSLMKTPTAQRSTMAVLLLIPIGAGALIWPYRNRSNDRVSENFVLNALDAMRPNSVLITGEWELYSPMLYFLEVEHRRPDVTAIQARLFTRPWYVDTLQTHAPAVMRPLQRELPAYRQSIQRLSEGFHDVPTLDAYHQSLNEVTATLFANAMQRGGMYATTDFMTASIEDYVDIARSLGRDNDFVPRGIVVQYLPRTGHREIDAHPLRLAGLADGTMRYDVDDPVVTEIIPTYLTGLMLRARILALTRHFPEAIADYEHALELDPGNSTLERELQSVIALRDQGTGVAAGRR